MKTHSHRFVAGSDLGGIKGGVLFFFLTPLCKSVSQYFWRNSLLFFFRTGGKKKYFFSPRSGEIFLDIIFSRMCGEKSINNFVYLLSNTRRKIIQNRLIFSTTRKKKVIRFLPYLLSNARREIIQNKHTIELNQREGFFFFSTTRKKK